MNRFFRVLLPVLVLTCLASCKKDNVLFYNDVTFVNAAAGVYTTDAGLQYIPVENKTDRELPLEGRLIVSCDILRKVSPGVYEVRVNAFSQPLTKDPVPAGEAPEADDPLYIESGWFSGGYLNALLGLYVKDESEVKHIINVEYTLPTEESDTLYLRLRHDALGECPADPDDDADEYSFARTYTCFHLDGLLPSGSEVPVKIIWRWYDKDHSAPLKEYSYKLNLLF